MKRQAILFTAGKYPSTKNIKIDELTGVSYDIVAMDKRLTQIGFDVIKKENAHMADYPDILKCYSEGLATDSISIIYFSGHGGHYKGKNYIIPSDFCLNFDATRDIDKSCVNTQDLISIFKNKGRLILILDACSRKVVMNTKKEVKVSGHLEAIGGVYHMKLSWIDDAGKRRRKSKSTGLAERGNKKRANDMLIDFMREQEAEIAASGDSATDILFTDYMQQWLKRVKPSIQLTTYSGYRDNVCRIIIPYFKPFELKLRDVTAQHIQDFYAEQMKRVSGKTVKRYHANIHKAFKDARRLQIIDSNPMDCVEPPKAQPFHGQAYTIEESQKILALVSDTIFEIPITMMLFYGLRREEAIGLKWSNIDFENDSILIGHTVTETRVDGHLQMIQKDLTKNNSSFRSLPLVAPIKELLNEKRKSIYECKKLFKSGYCSKYSDYVCVNEIGELIRPRTLSDNFKRIIKKNNIRNLRLYDCRHTAASIMLKNGVSMKQIQMILGHSDYATTANIYSHLDYADKVSATKEMQNILYGNE